LTPYLRSRPLHSTQTEQAQAETKDWTRFSLRLAPTDDFVNELLKQGPWLKVISPESLRTQMRKNAQEILKHYE
ncbi:MAG: WYL domain-containing protein, partial [Bacteroidaceae bacterium]